MPHDSLETAAFIQLVSCCSLTNGSIGDTKIDKWKSWSSVEWKGEARQKVIFCL